MVQTLSFVNEQAISTPAESSVGMRSLVRCAPRFSRSSWLTGVSTISVKEVRSMAERRSAAA